VFGPIFVLAIPARITLAASAATFVLFMVSLEVLSAKRWARAVVRNR